MNFRQMREAVGYTRTRLAKEAGISRWRLLLAENEGLELSEAEDRALRRVLKPLLLELTRNVMEFQST